MSAKIPSSKFIGQKFNNLTVMAEAKSDSKYRQVMAKCVCGDVKKYHLDNIRSGKSKSCGCVKNPFIKHGLYNHKLYHVWAGIKNRCYNKNDSVFKSYGGRGVEMCDEWRNDFQAFYDWALSNGWKDGLEIDKDIKGNGKLYSPNTCIFVTAKENCNSRRTSKFVTIDGQTKTVAQWSDLYKISQQVIYKRTKRGWDAERAIKTPLQC